MNPILKWIYTILAGLLFILAILAAVTCFLVTGWCGYKSGRSRSTNV
jgi:hypothetical protein